MFSSVRKYFTKKNQDLTLLQLFRPIYIMLIVIGLFPYCVNYKTKHHCVIIPRTIYLNCLCAVTMVLVMFVLGSMDILEETSFISFGDGGMMTEVNYVVEAVLLLVSCLVAYISVYYYRYKIINLLNDIAAAWIELPVTNNRALETLRFRIVFSLVCLSILSLTHFQACIWWKSGPWKKVLITFTFVVPQLIHFVALLFYNVLVLMVVAVLSNIEEVIKTLRETKDVVQIINKGETSLPSIRRLELICVKAFELKRGINDTFQATILVTCMQCFHAMVSEGHLIYHGVIVASELTTHEIINFTLWILYQVIKIYSLAFSGNVLNMVSCRIGQALHNIPPETQDLRSLLEIQHFSSLMSFQATELTAYGYFALDASLLFKITASAAIYLIILVQFDRIK